MEARSETATQAPENPHRFGFACKAPPIADTENRTCLAQNIHLDQDHLLQEQLFSAVTVFLSSKWWAENAEEKGQEKKRGLFY